MPGATPLPRPPSALLLGSPEALLTGSGCPVCRYVAEVADQYLAWFALEGHADAIGITRLCGSLGMCPRHTRVLMSQPGAAIRLTAVYAYVVRAARQQLDARPVRQAPCPACDHSEGTATRALDVLLDGLVEVSVRDRYLEVGGLCIPHLRAGVRRGRRRVTAWLVQATLPSRRGAPPSLALLAGGPDRDAQTRAALRARLPTASDAPGTCAVCLAAARREHQELMRAAGSGRLRDVCGTVQSCCGSRLCRWHLRDAVLTGGSQVPALLTRQARCEVTGLNWLSSWWPSRVIQHRPARSRQQETGKCHVCVASEQAAWRGLKGHCAVIRELPPSKVSDVGLCVRDVFRLRSLDAAAGRVAAASAAKRADTLQEELREAFRASTWAYRQELSGPAMTAWQRSASFLDGRVFGGCPPPSV